jgi:hypothetical protein
LWNEIRLRKFHGFVKSRQSGRHSKKRQMQGARILRNDQAIEKIGFLPTVEMTGEILSTFYCAVLIVDTKSCKFHVSPFQGSTLDDLVLKSRQPLSSEFDLSLLLPNTETLNTLP